MTKCLFRDPAAVRAPRMIEFQPIPVNQYQKTVKDEKDNFSKKDLMYMYRDMAYIHEFETMINLIKTTSEYNGTHYTHPGPAHLAIGQEAAYVGQAYGLGVTDAIFGSHRSHGEILAKGLRSVELLDDDKLMEIMTTFFGGITYNVIKDSGSSVKEVAKNFVLYGTLAEIFARKTGFNRGLGGSMHAFFTPFGIFPNNAIVGGSGDIATGAAMYKLINKKPGLVVCNIGDASLACGPVWEAMMIAAMDQYHTLWGEDGGGVPLIYNIFNNQYGMGGQTCGETMGYGDPSRIGAGVNPEQMHAETVDGYNPLAVIDAFRRKKQIIDEKRGPVLLDVITYRVSGHSPSDSMTYRTKEEVEAWQKANSLDAFKAQMIEAGVATAKELEDVYAGVMADLDRTFKLAINDEISPRLDMIADPDAIAEMMFSNGRVVSFDTTRDAKMLTTFEENSRVQKIAKKERFAYDKDGKLVSKNKVFQLRDGLFEAIFKKFYEDPTLVAYGEDNRDWGGAFAVYQGVTESAPYNRFFNAPISEGSIVGSGVGYCMMGGRAIVELMYTDFLGRAGDEIFNQMSKWQSMSGNVLKMPLVLRMSVGSKYGAQHSQDWTALVSHIPGLKVCYPVTPYDAKGLMTTALNGTDPVVFFESQRIYDIGEMFHEGGVPEESYEIPFGEPDVKRVGSDITILSIGPTLYRVLKAADTLKEKYGVSAEIIDARSVVPFNYEKVVESVKKTGRILITSDECERGSVIKEMAATISELAFDYLDAPVTCVGARNWITPAHEIEDFFFPQPEWMLDAINERMLPLKGHVATSNATTGEILRNSKRGV